MAKKKSTKKSKPIIPFEASLSELEKVVSDLEMGKLSLDESLEKYESGMQHLRNCFAALRNAEKKIQILVDVDEAGNAQLAEFDHNATHREPEIDDDETEDEDSDEATLF